MKPTIDISSVLSDVNLPKRNLEAVANSGAIHDVFKNKIGLTGYEDVSWRFLNAIGIGNVQITFRDKYKNRLIYREIPASASFMAVCTKVPFGSYKLQFSISLS